jgi:hypothetical protein
MATTYTKLRTGAWGVRSTDRLAVGQTVTVTKRDGTRKAETIATIVWRGEGITLAALAPKGAATAAEAPAERPERGVRGCGECSRLGRMCGSCAFDEYDM